jgi:hypothetical protein
MSTRVFFWLKVALLLAVAAVVTWQLHKAWVKVEEKHLSIDWRWGFISMAGFAGSILTSALVWRRLAGKMRPETMGGRTVPLLGAYTYSQMGKYIWKVALLMMRIDRAGRLGMSARVCTLSTLLENALYMVSGAIVGMLAIVRVAGELEPGTRVFLWPVTIVVVVGLMTACYPPVFYNLVNRLLRKMKKPEVPRDQWLNAGTLACAAASFVPCWIFGGLALWGATCAVNPLSLVDCWWFGGAFALSAIVGMASFLPGGAVIRETVLGAAVALQFSAGGMEHPRAVLLGGAVAIILRIFQIATEVFLGLTGMTLTGRAASPAEAQTVSRAN